MLRDIKVLHLEPTDVCQAACPLCARETNPEFNKTQQHHLDMHKIQQVFAVDRIAALDKMFMCGNYGDPAAGRHTLDIYKEFRKLNPDITLGMNTNGALQNTHWWNKLGCIFDRPLDYVVFSIDGLEDTNHLYRKNVNWTKLIANAKAYIAAGGSAHWDMLVYKHNQHQVDACEQMARDIGCTWFRAKVSKRGFTDTLAAPVNWKLPQVQSTTIQCHALNEHSMYINAQGQTSPCCWLGSRQPAVVTDFDSIRESWTGPRPHPICLSTCASRNSSTSFTNQWQREIQLC